MEKVAFSLEEVNRIFKEEERYYKSGKLCIDPVNTKAYIEKYLFATMKGVYYLWNAEEQEFEFYDKASLKTAITDVFPKDIKDWFYYKNYKRFNVVCDFKKDTKDGNTLNSFKGLLHKHNIRKYEDYSVDIKRKVSLFLSFVKEVICNNNEAIFQHL